MVKMRIGNSLYDVISYEDFVSRINLYMQHIGRVAVFMDNGLVYPLIHASDTSNPGVWFDNIIVRFREPNPSVVDMYKIENAIDFSNAKNYGEVIQCQERLNRSEKAILTSINNVTIPDIGENDTPAMKALKEAIIAKGIDLDSYGYRFGEDNYPNDKRLLRRDSITLPKLKAYADALDLDITLIISDKDESVPNPMGKVIKTKINGDYNVE